MPPAGTTKVYKAHGIIIPADKPSSRSRPTTGAEKRFCFVFVQVGQALATIGGPRPPRCRRRRWMRSWRRGSTLRTPTSSTAAARPERPSSPGARGAEPLTQGSRPLQLAPAYQRNCRSLLEVLRNTLNCRSLLKYSAIHLCTPCFSRGRGLEPPARARVPSGLGATLST